MQKSVHGERDKALGTFPDVGEEIDTWLVSSRLARGFPIMPLRRPFLERSLKRGVIMFRQGTISENIFYSSILQKEQTQRNYSPLDGMPRINIPNRPAPPRQPRHPHPLEISSAAEAKKSTPVLLHKMRRCSLFGPRIGTIQTDFREEQSLQLTRNTSSLLITSPVPRSGFCTFRRTGRGAGTKKEEAIEYGIPRYEKTKMSSLWVN